MCCPILSVIILMINKLDSHFVVILRHHSYSPMCNLILHTEIYAPPKGEKHPPSLSLPERINNNLVCYLANEKGRQPYYLNGVFLIWYQCFCVQHIKGNSICDRVWLNKIPNFQNPLAAGGKIPWMAQFPFLFKKLGSFDVSIPTAVSWK